MNKDGNWWKITVTTTDIFKQNSMPPSPILMISNQWNTRSRFGVSGMMNSEISSITTKPSIGDYAMKVAYLEVLKVELLSMPKPDWCFAYKKGKIGIAASNLFESECQLTRCLENRGDGTFERVDTWKHNGSYEFKIVRPIDLEPFIIARNQRSK